MRGLSEGQGLPLAILRLLLSIRPIWVQPAEGACIKGLANLGTTRKRSSAVDFGHAAILSGCVS